MIPPQPLEVCDLKKDFGAVSALRSVSFAVERGEVFGYLGPNGAGKTTTLRIVLGLVRQTSGTARLFGRSADDVSSRDDIGFLPGDLRLYADMSALTALDFFARFRPARPPILRASLMDAFELDHGTLQRRIKFLSHGTRQKIGLIAAMQHDPALLLLDEPSNGLDPLVQHAFRKVVLDFAERGHAVLLSSHVLSEVEAICRRVAILKQGQIVALESIERLREKVMRKVTVRFRNQVPAFQDIPGISRCDAHDQEASLWVRGDINPLIRKLAEVEVDEVVFPEPELEDIFLAFYGRGTDRG